MLPNGNVEYRLVLSSEFFGDAIVTWCGLAATGGILVRVSQPQSDCQLVFLSG